MTKNNPTIHKRRSREIEVMRSTISSMQSRRFIDKPTYERLMANVAIVSSDHELRMRKHTKPTPVMRAVNWLNKPISEIFSK